MRHLHHQSCTCSSVQGSQTPSDSSSVVSVGSQGSSGRGTWPQRAGGRGTLQLWGGGGGGGVVDKVHVEYQRLNWLLKEAIVSG